MSNATLPPPRSSSLPPAADAGSRSDSSSGEGEFDTSLDQSTYSAMKEEGSGDSEGRQDNKQKRKRTSPADQALLEREYKQNPKPNKAARAEIVQKVSLNEKEVQIWFQNRRQINRRKSRPLLPHEIAAFGLGGMAALSSDPAPVAVLSGSQNMEIAGLGSQQVTSQKMPSSQEKTDSCQDEVEFLEPRSAEERILSEKGETVTVITDDNAAPLLPTLQRQSSSGISNLDNGTCSATQSVSRSFSSTPGYLANRWNPISSSLSTPSSSQLASFATPPTYNASQPVSCPERIESGPSSQVRLSMSLDGKAELVSTEPSPPRPYISRPSSSSGSMVPRQRMGGLQRSQSALPFSLASIMSHSNTPLVPRLPTGRSRDARTWEFCCDSEARDQLTTQAENESHGSAVAAISLIRSTNSSALKTNNNKRNAPSAKPESNKHGKKPKLGRAMSSLARLQSTEKSSLLSQNLSSHGKDSLMSSPSGDSDKENWVPNEGGNARRRPLPSSRSGKKSHSKAVLVDNLNIPTHAANFGGSRHRKRNSANVETNIFEDQENSGEAPQQVEKFMRGEISPSKKGDLDGVQALLSLSQGNWR